MESLHNLLNDAGKKAFSEALSEFGVDLTKRIPEPLGLKIRYQTNDSDIVLTLGKWDDE